mgnify:CR=1 FL=1
MQEHLGFLRVSSIVVKIAAWIFLFLGLAGAISLFSGIIPGNPRWMGAVIIVIYAFFFIFLYLVARIADILIQVIKEIKKQ